MDYRQRATYFARTPLSRYTGGMWVGLGVLGALSSFSSGQTALALNAGERRLVTNKPLPASATVIRFDPKFGGYGGHSEAYLVGSREAYGQPAMFVHRAPQALEIWHPQKTSGRPNGPVAAVTWTLQEATFGNPNYAGPQISREGYEVPAVINDTVFAAYTVTLPSDSTCDTEDEIRTTGYTFVVQNLYRLNSLLVATCSRKKAQA